MTHFHCVHMECIFLLHNMGNVRTVFCTFYAYGIAIEYCILLMDNYFFLPFCVQFFFFFLRGGVETSLPSHRFDRKHRHALCHSMNIKSLGVRPQEQISHQGPNQVCRKIIKESSFCTILLKS